MATSDDDVRTLVDARAEALGAKDIEHVSLPVDTASGMAVMDLRPSD